MVSRVFNFKNALQQRPNYRSIMVVNAHSKEVFFMLVMEKYALPYLLIAFKSVFMLMETQ